MDVSDLLAELIQAALDVAHFTDGAVDPTVGSAVVSLGYDDDFDLIDRDDPDQNGTPYSRRRVGERSSSMR